MKKIILIAAVAASLSACGTMNSFTAASLSSAQADGAQTIANIQKTDDMKFQAWSESACAMNLGALQRNATGNPNAIKGVLELCPVPNMGIVSVNSSSGSIAITAPSVSGAGTIAVQVNK